jgi:hypothetical protein
MKPPWAPSALLPALLFVVGCEAAVGDLVRCERLWLCDGNVVLEDVGDNAKVFCTDPSSDARDDQITAYGVEFAETCDNIQPDCLVGGVPFDVECQATCATGGGECPLTAVVAVKL